MKLHFETKQDKYDWFIKNFERLTYRELAEHLGTSIGTVSSIVHRLKARGVKLPPKKRGRRVEINYKRLNKNLKKRK